MEFEIQLSGEDWMELHTLAAAATDGEISAPLTLSLERQSTSRPRASAWRKTNHLPAYGSSAEALSRSASPRRCWKGTLRTISRIRLEKR